MHISRRIDHTARAHEVAPPISKHKVYFYLFVPDLQWFAADAVEDGQETRLKCVLEHL